MLQKYSQKLLNHIYTNVVFQEVVSTDGQDTAAVVRRLCNTRYE